jgi:replicative DNA helicase
MNDRLPPHNIDAEAISLGHCVAFPLESMPVAIDQIKTPEWFYDLRHRTIWEVLCAMFEDRAPIDSMTLMMRLREKGKEQDAGGIAYFSTLVDKAVSAVNLPFHLDIMRHCFIRRRLIDTFSNGITAAYEVPDGDEFEQFCDEAEREVLNVRQDQVDKDVEVRTLVHKAIDEIEIRHQNQGKLGGLATGFTDFDRMTDGLQPSEMIVVAARPSVGKTSFAMNIAEAVALDQQLPTGVFSLEMSGQALIKRMICSRARVNMKSVRDGFLHERDFPKLSTVAGKISRAPIYIDDRSALSINQVRAKARRWWQQYGIKLLIIDYLQLMVATSKKALANRQVEVSEISHGVKGIAKDLGIPVIVIAQLNRAVEQTGGKKQKPRKPRVSDLRESGSIEQDADVVVLLYNDEEEDSDKPKSDGQRVGVIVGKQRNGDVGEFGLTFLKSYTRFENMARVDHDEPPFTEPNEPMPAPEPPQMSMPYPD